MMKIKKIVLTERNGGKLQERLVNHECDTPTNEDVQHLVATFEEAIRNPECQTLIVRFEAEEVK